MASLSTLPLEIMEEIIEHLYILGKYSSMTLNSLSLVEKKFYPSVKKRMHKRLFLNVHGAEKAVIFFSENPELASMITEIYIYCNQMSEFEEWAATGGPQIIDTLELGTFNEIIELTPNLRILEINSCEELIKQQSEDLQLATLDQVTSLKLGYSFPYNGFGDHITQFINLVSTPQIEKFTLSLNGHLLRSSSSKFTTSTFPIRHLKVSSFSREGSLLQLPIESFVSLQTMVLDCDVTLDSLAEVIKVCGPTLKALMLRSSNSTPYSYTSFAKLFPQLTVVKELAIWRVQDLPEDFFQHLPSTNYSFRSFSSSTSTFTTSSESSSISTQTTGNTHREAN